MFFFTLVFEIKTPLKSIIFTFRFYVKSNKRDDFDESDDDCIGLLCNFLDR